MRFNITSHAVDVHKNVLTDAFLMNAHNTYFIETRCGSNENPKHYALCRIEENYRKKYQHDKG